MKKTYTITTTSAQFVALANKISSELKREGRNVVTVQHPVFVGVYTLDMSWQEIERERGENLANYKGDARVFICAESKALRDKGITVIVKDWNGENSKLVIEYRDNDDWELAKDTWQIFEERIKQKGWNLTPTPTAAFAPAIVHDVRHLFDDVRGDSRQEQIKAMKLLHGLGTHAKTPTDEQTRQDGRAGTPQIVDAANENVTMDSIEIPVSWTPYECATFITDFGEKQRAANPDAPRYYISNVPKRTIPNQRQVGTRSIPQSEIDYGALQGSSRLIVKCVCGGGLIEGKYEAENHLGEIIALKIPNDGTWLRIVPDTENAAEFLREWELLRQEIIRWGFSHRSGQDMTENTQTHTRIESEANGKGTDVGAAVEHLLSLQNNYECSVRWLNRREDREPHRKQTIELEYAESGFDERFGQSYRRMLSQAHIEIYPKPSGSHITFTYSDEHAHIYLPFWNDLYRLMVEWGIIAKTVTTRPEQPTWHGNGEPPKTKRGANDDTREKLKKLVEIRAQSKRNEKIMIAWTTACQQAGITPSTAKTHLPELNRLWNDANYNPVPGDL